MAATVLLVEPDAAARDSIRERLQRQEWAVEPVDSGTEALELAAGHPFDVILSALALPGMDGLTLLARVRESRPDQEFILMVDRPETRARAVEVGITDCLLRPVDEAELDLAVQRCLERLKLRLEQRRLQEENIDLSRSHTIYQRCLDLLANTDLEWLQERVVLELSSSADAQSAGLWMVDERNELRLRSYRGLLDRHGLGDKLSPTAELQPRLREGRPWLVGQGRDQVLWAPLSAHGEPVGLAQLSDPLAGAFSEEHLHSVKLLADFAAVGLRNGRKFLQLQRLGLRDRDSAAYNLSYFTDYASKEMYKARRYGRIFSLIVFSLDQLPAARARLGQDEVRKGTRGVIRALARIIRDSDVIAKATEQDYYLLLPETDFFGASLFIRRALAAVHDEPEVKELEQRCPLGLTCGAAAFPKDGEDFDELVHRCRVRADERRASLQRTLQLEALSFWEQVEVLLGSPGSPGLPQDARAEPSRRGKVSGALFTDLQAEVARELSRDPLSRGVVYLGGQEVRADLPLATALEAAFGGTQAELAVRVYALGRRADLQSHPVITPVFLEGDERIGRHEFLLWLSDRSAYALLQRPGRGATWGFHTSDTAVVDGLITKLQAEYDLQPY